MRKKELSGFSIVELLLVVGLVGLMLWVLIPLGLRARVEARYSVVRQSCSELASHVSQWAFQFILAQDELGSVASICDYYGSLAGLTRAPSLGGAPGEWVANSSGPTNWRQNRDLPEAERRRPIDGRCLNGKQPTAPEATVEDMVPPSHPILNPFNKTSIFDSRNHPRPMAEGGVGPEPGAIALGAHREDVGGWVYFAFVFQGVENTGVDLEGSNTFLPDMNLTTMAGLRNGVFAARLR